MPRPQSPSTSLTIGQLAKRWSVAESRIRELIDAGFIAGVFRIPAAGRYRETLKIPLDSIVEAERDWAVVPATSGLTRSRKSPPSATAAFRHFPELIDDQEPAAESREVDRS